MMVNKVDGNNYYEYTRPKAVNASDTGEKFSLEHNRDGLPKEVEDREKDKAEVPKRQKAAEQSGVKLELSSSGLAAGRDGQKQLKEAGSPETLGKTSLVETVRALITTAIEAVRDFINKIWNEPQAEDIVQDSSDITTQEIMDPAVQEGLEVGAQQGVDADIPEAVDRLIQQYLQKGDVDQAINLLTDNGKRTVARNSTLMTSYDRNGRVIEPETPVWEKNVYKGGSDPYEKK